MSIRIASLGLVLFAAVTPATLLAGQSAQRSTQLCWRSLQDAPQDEPPGIAESMLIAAGPDDIWLARPNGAHRLLSDGYRVNGARRIWHVQATTCGQRQWPHRRPETSSLPPRRIFENTARVLHIARMMNGAWQWLGNALISSGSEHSCTTGKNGFCGRPTRCCMVGIAGARAAALVRCALEWRVVDAARLTESSQPDTFLITRQSPSIRNSRSGSRGATKRKSASCAGTARMWIDVGRDSLKTVSAAQGPAALREISLAVGTNGDAWVLRLASKTMPGAAISLARWDRPSWRGVAAPPGPAGKDSTAWSASMILRNNAPIVAWSQADETDNHHVYVAAWTEGRWIGATCLSGTAFGGGYVESDRRRLAAGDARRPLHLVGRTREGQTEHCAWSAGLLVPGG